MDSDFSNSSLNIIASNNPDVSSRLIIAYFFEFFFEVLTDIDDINAARVTTLFSDSFLISLILL